MINVCRFNKLSIYIKELKQEIDICVAKNIINADIEEKIARDFKECKSDMVNILLLLNVNIK